MRARGRIQRAAEAGGHVWQRIGKVLVLAAPKAVARHHDPAAEWLVHRIGLCQRDALLRREHRAHDGVAMDVEVGGEARPIERRNPLGDVCVGCRRAGRDRAQRLPDSLRPCPAQRGADRARAPVRRRSRPPWPPRAHVVRAVPSTTAGNRPLSSARHSRRGHRHSDRGGPRPPNAPHREKRTVTPSRVSSL
jgi:hypothetical protein